MLHTLTATVLPSHKARCTVPEVPDPTASLSSIFLGLISQSASCSYLPVHVNRPQLLIASRFRSCDCCFPARTHAGLEVRGRVLQASCEAGRVVQPNLHIDPAKAVTCWRVVCSFGGDSPNVSVKNVRSRDLRC